MRPAHPVRHRLFRHANQLPVVPASHCRPAGAAFRRRSPGCAASSTASPAGPFDKTNHHGSGSGTAICRRARRSTGGQTQIEGAANYSGHHRVRGGSGRTRRGIGWFGFSKYKEHKAAKKANPAAQVATPTSNATIQALSILTKVHSAYTNFTSVKEDGTFTLFLELVEPHASPM